MAHVQEVVDPVMFVAMLAIKRFTLRQFIVVVREREIDTSGVQVHARA